MRHVSVQASDESDVATFEREAAALARRASSLIREVLSLKQEAIHLCDAAYALAGDRGHFSVADAWNSNLPDEYIHI
jgi:hypothetical protein